MYIYISLLISIIILIFLFYDIIKRENEKAKISLKNFFIIFLNYELSGKIIFLIIFILALIPVVNITILFFASIYILIEYVNLDKMFGKFKNKELELNEKRK